MEELDLAEMSFEQVFEALKEAVNQLEGGDLPLDQSLEAFERGMRLAQRCSEYLDQAELRVRELQGADEGGEETTSAAQGKGEQIPF